jgi:hypothetical protein
LPSLALRVRLSQEERGRTLGREAVLIELRVRLSQEERGRTLGREAVLIELRVRLSQEERSRGGPFFLSENSPRARGGPLLPQGKG